MNDDRVVSRKIIWKLILMLRCPWEKQRVLFFKVVQLIDIFISGRYKIPCCSKMSVPYVGFDTLTVPVEVGEILMPTSDWNVLPIVASGSVVGFQLVRFSVQSYDYVLLVFTFSFNVSDPSFKIFIALFFLLI